MMETDQNHRLWVHDVRSEYCGTGLVAANAIQVFVTAKEASRGKFGPKEDTYDNLDNQQGRKRKHKANWMTSMNKKTRGV